ncbi:MAG: hypothetical protein ABJA67_04660, partial [Chthonomonadales bacterium]
SVVQHASPIGQAQDIYYRSSPSLVNPEGHLFLKGEQTANPLAMAKKTLTPSQGRSLYQKTMHRSQGNSG